MTEVEFRVGAADPQEYACGLLRAAWTKGARLLVRVAPEQIDAFDLKLWTFSQPDFLPHCRSGDPLQSRTPIVLTTADDLGAGDVRDCLLNLAPTPLGGWQSWPRLIEVVGAEPQARQAARLRFRLYRDAGCQPSTTEIKP